MHALTLNPRSKIASNMWFDLINYLQFSTIFSLGTIPSQVIHFYNHKQLYFFDLNFCPLVKPKIRDFCNEFFYCSAKKEILLKSRQMVHWDILSLQGKHIGNVSLKSTKIPEKKNQQQQNGDFRSEAHLRFSNVNFQNTSRYLARSSWKSRVCVPDIRDCSTARARKFQMD